jgi:hypothetical protein
MDSELAAELWQLRGVVGVSLQQAIRKLTAGLNRTLTSPESFKDLSAATFKLRWRWQDELARILRRYAARLSRLGRQHQVPDVADWVAAELRDRFPALVEHKLQDEFDPQFRLDAKLGSFRSRPRPLNYGADGEPDIMAKRTRPSRLRGELILFNGKRQIRVPVVVSAHVSFLESKLLAVLNLVRTGDCGRTLASPLSIDLPVGCFKSIATGGVSALIKGRLVFLTCLG